MGRPIKDKFFGDPSGPYKQFDDIDAWIPGEAGPEKCYIVRQKTNHRFIMHGKTSGNEGRCKLVDKAAGSLAEGEMMMLATSFGGSPERVKQLTDNKVQTFSGNRYLYTKDKRAEQIGECDLSSYAGRPFITTWRTTSDNETITLPLTNGFYTPDGLIDVTSLNFFGKYLYPSNDYDYTAENTVAAPACEPLEIKYNMLVDWGDGSTDLITEWDQAERAHTYATAGDYNISIYGRCDALYFHSSIDPEKCIAIVQWGDIKWKSFNNMLRETSITEIDCPDKPNLSECYNMSRFCVNALNLVTADLSNWDVKNITVMYITLGQYFPTGGSLTTVDVTGWDTRNLKLMCYMGYISNKVSPTQTWIGINELDTTSVEHWWTTFPCGNLDMSKLATRSTRSFNFVKYNDGVSERDFDGIEYWDTSNARSIQWTSGTQSQAIHRDLTRWNVSKVESLNSAFENAQWSSIDLSGWEVTKCRDFGEMFEKMINLTSLDLTSFHTNSATVMRNMFNQCTNLVDLKIPNFSFRKVTTLNNFMSNSPNIDMTEIGDQMASWDISNVTTATNFMTGGPTLTTAQYDAILIAWSQLPVQAGVTWHFGAAQYTAGGAAEAARDVLTGAPNNWIITDGGAAP